MRRPRKPRDVGGKADDPDRDFSGQSRPLPGRKEQRLVDCLGPLKEAVVFTQALGFAEIDLAHGMQARHYIHPFKGERRQGSVLFESPVS